MFVFVGTEEKRKKRECVERGKERGRKEGVRDVGLSHPVPCCGDMSFSSIHREKARERGMEQWRGREDRNTAPSSPLCLRSLRPQPQPETFSTVKLWKERYFKKARQHANNFFRYIVFYPSTTADFHKHVAHAHTHTHINMHISELTLPSVFPWCVFHTPPLLPPWSV